MPDPVSLVTTKPDAELAREFRQQLIEAYEPVLAILNKIVAAGFAAQIATGRDATGKCNITNLHIVKEF